MMKFILPIIFISILNNALSQTSNGSSNTTITCPFGYFVSNSNTCVQCLTGCSKCKNLLSPCHGCAEGYKLSQNGNQCESCALGQLYCDVRGITCQRYYQPLNGQCQPICQVQNCAQCNSIFAKTCNQCQNQYILNPQSNICTTTRVSSQRRNLQSQTGTTTTSATSTTATSGTTNPSQSGSIFSNTDDQRLNNILSQFGAFSQGLNNLNIGGSSAFTPIDANQLIRQISSGGTFNIFGNTGNTNFGSGTSTGSSTSNTSFNSNSFNTGGNSGGFPTNNNINGAGGQGSTSTSTSTATQTTSFSTSGNPGLNNFNNSTFGNTGTSGSTSTSFGSSGSSNGFGSQTTLTPSVTSFISDVPSFSASTTGSTGTSSTTSNNTSSIRISNTTTTSTSFGNSGSNFGTFDTTFPGSTSTSSSSFNSGTSFSNINIPSTSTSSTSSSTNFVNLYPNDPVLTLPGVTGPFTNDQGLTYYMVNGQTYYPEGSTVVSNRTTTTTTAIPGSSSSSGISTSASTSTTVVPGTTITTPFITPINTTISGGTTTIVTPPIVTPPIITPISTVTNNQTSISGTGSTTTTTTTSNIQPITDTTVIIPGGSITTANTTILNSTTVNTANATVIPPIVTPVTPIVTPPVVVVNTNRACSINQYNDPNRGCLPCNSRCGTCINSADQCLQCNVNAGYIKIGWKCITNQSVNFRINQTASASLGESYVLGEGINDFKRSFLQYILPASYAGSSLSVISFTKVIYDQVSHTISFDGYVDKLPGININDLNKTISDNLKVAGIIAPFGPIIVQKVNAYPYDIALAPNNTRNDTVATVDHVAPKNVSSGVNLAAILVPSIIGGLLLLSLLSCLLCYFFKWCCFKKKGQAAGTETDTANQEKIVKPVENFASVPITYTGESSDRRMAPIKLQNTEQLVTYEPLKTSSVPIVNMANMASASTTVPVVQSTHHKRRGSKIKKVPTVTSISNTQIIETNRMIDDKTPIVIASGSNANNLSTNIYETRKFEKLASLGSLGAESIREVIPATKQKITVVNNSQNFRSSSIVDGSVRGVLPVVSTTILPSVPVVTSLNPATTTTTVVRTTQPMSSSRVITTQTNQVPLINSTVTLGNSVFGQPKAITTVTKNEKQERQMIGNNEVKIVKNTHIIQETNLSPRSQHNIEQYTRINSTNNINNTSIKHYYYQDGKRIYTNQTSGVNDQLYPTSNYIISQNIEPLHTNSRVVINETSSYSPGSQRTIQGETVNYRTGNIVKHSFKNGKLISEQISSGEIPSEFGSNKSIQYIYTNGDGKEISNYLKKQDELRNLGIKDLTNKVDFYEGDGNNYTYETKTQTKTIQRSYNQLYN